MTLRLRFSPLLVAGLLALPAQAQPASSDPETAYRAAYQFIARERYDEAYTAMQAYERTYAQSRHADEAGFWSCFSLEHLTARRTDADSCYAAFTQRYPQSGWRDDAETRRLQLAARGAGARGAQGTYNAALAERLASVYTTAPPPAVWSPANGVTRLTLSDASVEVLAVQALARPGNDAAVDDLRRLALESASPAVRQASIGALARIGTARSGAALGELVGGLLDRAAARDSVAAMAASEAIMQAARRGDNTLLPFVERYYRNTNVPARLRWTLLTSTRQIGTTEARAFQWRALQADVLPARERAEVAQWLAYNITADELTRLGSLMRGESNAEVREGYARALRTIVGGASVWASVNGFGVNALTTADVVAVGGQTTIIAPPALADQEATVADLYESAHALALSAPASFAEAREGAEERHRDREALIVQAMGLAATQLRTEQNERVQMALVGALAAAGYDQGVEPLSTLVLNPGASEPVRTEAIEGLGRIGTEAAFEALRNALRRVDAPRVLRSGIMALVSTPGFRVRAEAVPDLVRFTSHADLTVRRTAVDALGRMDAPQARQALLDLIRRSSSN